MSELQWAKKDYTFAFSQYLVEGWGLFSRHWKTLLPYAAITTAFSKAIELIGNDYIVALILFLTWPLFHGGVYVFLIRFSRGERACFGDLFKGFAFPYILPIILANITAALAIGLGLILLILPGLVLWIGSFFFVTLIALDRDPGAINSLKGSLYIVNKHWPHFTGLFLILFFLEVGAYWSKVGLVFTMPLTTCILFSIYRKSVGLAKTS